MKITKDQVSVSLNIIIIDILKAIGKRIKDMAKVMKFLAMVISISDNTNMGKSLVKDFTNGLVVTHMMENLFRDLDMVTVFGKELKGTVT